MNCLKVVGYPKSFITCTSDADCEDTGVNCQMEQEDINENSCADVCECYTDFNEDGKASTWDFAVYQYESGRRPCACQQEQKQTISITEVRERR